MRIAIGAIHHETNCFAKEPTLLAYFEAGQAVGNRIIENRKGTRSYLGGMIDELTARGVEVVGGYDASTMPSGIIAKEAAETIAQRMTDTMWQAHLEQPLDAIALNLHGAGAAQEHPDLEGYVLSVLRARFGKDMPIGIVMDLHANMTQEMIDLSDVAVGVKCYPHVDEYEAARIMTGMLYDVVTTGVRPCKKLIKLPWYIVSAAGVTLSGPAAQVKQYCLEVERDEDVLQASFFHGFPYGDVPACGVSVVTMAKTQYAADESAMKLARFAWNLRQVFTPKVFDAWEAVEEALRHEGIVVIGESSDNPGGGAPGDGTYLLKAMIAKNEPGSVFMGIYDPEVVKQARKIGVGGVLSCLLGGKTDDLHGTPIALNANILAFSDGRFVNRSAMGQGTVYDMGDTVLLQEGNVKIIVVSKRLQPKDDGLMETVGIDYRQQRLIAVKSSHHFKAWWMEHSNAIVNADPPGIHCANLSCFDFKHASKSYYPLQDTQWEG